MTTTTQRCGRGKVWDLETFRTSYTMTTRCACSPINPHGHGTEMAKHTYQQPHEAFKWCRSFSIAAACSVIAAHVHQE